MERKNMWKVTGSDFNFQYSGQKSPTARTTQSKPVKRVSLVSPKAKTSQLTLNRNLSLTSPAASKNNKFTSCTSPSKTFSSRSPVPYNRRNVLSPKSYDLVASIKKTWNKTSPPSNAVVAQNFYREVGKTPTGRSKSLYQETNKLNLSTTRDYMTEKLTTIYVRFSHLPFLKLESIIPKKCDLLPCPELNGFLGDGAYQVIMDIYSHNQVTCQVLLDNNEIDAHIIGTYLTSLEKWMVGIAPEVSASQRNKLMNELKFILKNNHSPHCDEELVCHLSLDVVNSQKAVVEKMLQALK